MATVDRLAVLIIGCTLLQILLARSALYAGARLGERIAARVRQRFLDRALALPAATVEHIATGDLIARATSDVSSVAATLRSAVPEVFVAVVQMVAITVAIVVLDPVFGVFGLTCMVVAALLLRWYLRRARKAYLAQGAALSGMADVMVTTAAGARTVDALSLRQRRDQAARTAASRWPAEPLDRFRLAPIGFLWKPIGMTTDSVPAGGDPRRLLSDVRALAHRVRLDQRMTWAALLALAAVTLVAIPFDWFGMKVHCNADASCEFARWGMLYYWPPASLLAYAAIAFCYLRAARARGLGARVLPYAITGAATAFVFPAAWLAMSMYLSSHPVPAGPLPYWWLVLDRLVMPWSMIGVTLLVLAWLERNVALLLFTLAYLTLVLLVLPLNSGLGPPHWGIRANMAVPQLIVSVLLLLGAVGFRAARLRNR